MRRIKLPILLLMCGLFVTACQPDQFERSAYKALAADQTVFNRLTDEVHNRYLAGAITDAQFERAADLTEKWGAAHNAAVTALEVYHVSRHSQNDEQKVLTALAYSHQILTDLYDLLYSLGVVDEGRVA